MNIPMLAMGAAGLYLYMKSKASAPAAPAAKKTSGSDNWLSAGITGGSSLLTGLLRGSGTQDSAVKPSGGTPVSDATPWGGMEESLLGGSYETGGNDPTWGEGGEG